MIEEGLKRETLNFECIMRVSHDSLSKLQTPNNAEEGRKNKNNKTVLFHNEEEKIDNNIKFVTSCSVS